MNPRARWLLVLQALFLGRVLGQVVATLAGPAWLPAPVHWFSGALPYHWLLPAQILLLMLMTAVTGDAVRGAGFWHVERPRTRRVLRLAAYAYFAVNAARWVLTMLLAPELRWTGHAIPITFHFVLASYVYVLSLDAEARRGGAGRAGSAAQGCSNSPEAVEPDMTSSMSKPWTTWSNRAS